VPRPQTLEERTEFSSRIHEQTVPLIYKHTVPILQRTYEASTLLGTGVLMQIADAYFLLSAAHVLAEVKDVRAMFVPGAGDQGQTLRGEFAFSPPDDDRDVGVVRLDSDVAELLRAGGWEFLRMNKVVCLKGDELPPAVYALYGYPIELHKRPGGVLEPRPYWHGTRRHAKTASELGLNPERHVVLKLHPEEDDDFICAGLERNRIPHLGGISGCGMWLVCDDQDLDTPEAWSADNYLLAGIEHAFQTQSGYIKVTTLTTLLSLIAATFPELAGPITLLRPIRRNYAQAHVTRGPG